MLSPSVLTNISLSSFAEPRKAWKEQRTEGCTSTPNHCALCARINKRTESLCIHAAPKIPVEVQKGLWLHHIMPKEQQMHLTLVAVISPDHTLVIVHWNHAVYDCPVALL